ncbi:CheR family methyltransferase [Acidisoma sp.]|uniref:CheR family methyltransferase n=1 Tax=Acidisoma sp. TaxID=1872115 RepID=UPI003B00D3FE
MSAPGTGVPATPHRDDEASFAALKRAVIDRTGHHYYADKDDLLRDRLDRRLKTTRSAGWAGYLALLSDPDEGAAEWQELEAEITIGETFFFRHAEQFEALEKVILPAIIDRNASHRRLRVWSAGCAVGAEPYSIAILLERLLGKSFPDWSVDILGSDISHRFLEKARVGCFSNWALRGMADEERARHFEATRDPKQWQIAHRHRRHVRFVQHNLLSLIHGQQSAEFGGFDLILCRNVLIYFSQERIAPMMSVLGRCLGPHGWLMVGYSDAIANVPKDLGIVELAGTIAFRPPGLVPARTAPVPAPVPAPVLTPAPVPTPVAWERSRRPPPVPASSETTATGRAAAGSAGPSLDTIRGLADAGRLQEAAQACKRALEDHPLDARLHFYDGVIAQAGGERARAEAAFRGAIYLAGHMVVAHYHLGLLLLDGATPEAGRRIMTEVVKLCATLPQAEALPESDGLTPRDLVERVEMRLRARVTEARPAGAPPGRMVNDRTSSRGA